jgi:prepilin-type N-terminal cleavage/methylation domain-containing protein
MPVAKTKRLWSRSVERSGFFKIFMHKDAQKIMTFSQTGMSLVEVLVAIVLFSLGSLMVLTMTTSSFRANSNSHAIDESVNLGRVNMERLLSLDYTSGDLQDTNADGTAGLLSADVANADHNSASGRYRVVWNVANNTPVNGTKTLAVIVSWQSNPGEKNVVFQTIKSE